MLRETFRQMGKTIPIKIPLTKPIKILYEKISSRIKNKLREKKNNQ